ncbi:helix-turn-helix transcriptional regulator [Coleofasciculus sp. FACHB-712]|uniref:helix-turn-helix domain-containing protein n=1 Tax=Coleofasciculus sp. FACHB-712 TaxID=2692789 RepID=UPI001682B2DE|nr:helix-turn-helix transcriptional regulator [Coleofasciculus sp. FACHB-712]MBD1944549.1 helix-turn-helix transcriptional regulator [Coleofasciculus sp. FACHB-712]
MTDKNYIYQYAEKLRTASNLKLIVIKQLLIEISCQYLSWTINPTIHEKKINFHSLNLSCDPVIATANIEKLLEEYFIDKDFWTQKAEWILSRIDAWVKGNKNPEESKLIFRLQRGILKKDSTPEDRLIAVCAIATSREFIQKFRILELSLEELEKLLGIKAPGNLTLVPEPRLYQNCDFEAFPTSAPYSTWFRVAPYPHKWQEKGIHSKSFSKGRLVKIQIVGTDLRTGRETILEGDPAWNIIKSLNWDTLKLNLILLMYALKAKGNSFIVKGTDILKSFNNKRTDLNIEVKLRNLKQQFEILRTQSVKVLWHIGSGGSQQNLNCDLAIESAGLDDILMWIIPHIRYQIMPEKELFVEVIPGKVFSLFYVNDNQAGHQISYLPKEIVELDTYKYWRELAIGIYTLLEYRIRRNRHHRIETIIRETIPSDEIEAALSNRVKGSRLKKRILKCFDFYKAKNWSVTLDFPSGGFSEFLEGTVDIIPRSPIPELQSRLERRTQPKPETPKLQPAPKNSDSGNWLREARTEMKWSMGQLAKYSGVDKSVISRIEQGKRNATPETMTKLRQALESGS